MEPKVQTRVEDDQSSIDMVPSSEERVGNFRKIRFKINGIKDPLTVLSIYENYVKQALTSNEGKKWTLGLKIRISREYPTISGENERQEEIIGFTSKFNICLRINSDFIKCYSNARQKISNDFLSWLRDGSSWQFERTEELTVSIAGYNPIKNNGGSWFPLPRKLSRRKRAILNIKNEDLRCFEYCILAALCFNNKKFEREGEKYKNKLCDPKYYKNKGQLLNMEGTSCPMQLDEISVFESNNKKIGVNVWVSEYDEDSIKPMYSSEKKNPEHMVNLLLIQNENQSHYTLITDLGYLFKSSGYNKSAVWRHSSVFCTKEFKLKDMSESQKKLHIKNCVENNNSLENNPEPKKIIPFGEDSIIKFESYGKQLKSNFVFYADFETLNINLATTEPPPCKKMKTKKNFQNSYTWEKSIQTAYSFCLVLVAEGGYSRPPKVYRGEDAGEVFIDTVLEWAEEAQQWYNENEVEMILTREDENEFQNSTMCHLCDSEIDDPEEKVRNHDHLTGKFLGAAHNKCNLAYKQPAKCSVFLHNLKNFDSNLIVKNIKERHPDPKVVGQTIDKYVTFSIGNVMFKDTFQFLSSSLSNLVENLKANKEKNLNQNFAVTYKYFKENWEKKLKQKGYDIEESFSMFTRKLIFSYRYIDSMDKFKEKIPGQEYFYNELTEETVSDQDYQMLLDLCERFGLKYLGELSDLYVQLDTLLLADIFENLRETSMKAIGLDPSHFCTAPGLSWAGALKFSKAELEIPSEMEFINFVDSNVRGGIAQGSIPFSRANNPQMKDYNEEEPDSYIYMFDCNGLYARSMQEKLPCGGFCKVPPNSEDWLNIDTEGEHGYFLEVTLNYPKHLHDLHDGFPLCPYHDSPSLSDLSNYQKKMAEEHGLTKSKVKKLMITFKQRKRIGLHIRNLQFYTNLGMELVKVHKVFKFSQSAYLKSYMDLCHQIKTSTGSTVMRQFGKLLANR